MKKISSEYLINTKFDLVIEIQKRIHWKNATLYGINSFEHDDTILSSRVESLFKFKFE